METLTNKFENKYVVVEKIETNDNDIRVKFNSIGIYSQAILFVKKYKYNKNNIHLVVNDVEYVLRLKDVEIVKVSLYDNNTK